MKHSQILAAAGAVLLLAVVPLQAQEYLTTIGDACIALEPHEGDNNRDDNERNERNDNRLREHALVLAQVEPELPGGFVRLYFRRMDVEVEDFYYVAMYPQGGGEYWGVLPDPEDYEPIRHEIAEYEEEEEEIRWAMWWRAKEESDHRDPNDPVNESELDDELILERASLGKLVPRDWMQKMTDEELQEWLESLENQPTEYYAAHFNSAGELISQSELKVGPVEDYCEVERLTEVQVGESYNQTVGETAEWQIDKSVYHWECDHVVTRIDPYGVKKADGICRACAIAWWQAGWVPLALAGPPVPLLPNDDPREPPPIFEQPASPAAP